MTPGDKLFFRDVIMVVTTVAIVAWSVQQMVTRERFPWFSSLILLAWLSLWWCYVVISALHWDPFGAPLLCRPRLSRALPIAQHGHVPTIGEVGSRVCKTGSRCERGEKWNWAFVGDPGTILYAWSAIASPWDRGNTDRHIATASSSLLPNSKPRGRTQFLSFLAI